MDNFFNVFIIIFLFASVVCLIYSITTLVILNNRKLYCKFYCKENYKLWEKLIKNINAFTFDYDSRVFTDMGYDTPIEWRFVGIVDNVPYHIIKYKEEDGVNAFRDDENKTVLTNFDTYHSIKMQNLLLANLTDEIRDEGNKNFINSL